MSEPTINFHLQTHLTQFKVPTELIRKNFKTIQKLIEKQKKQLTNDIAKINKNASMPRSIKLEMVRKLIKGFETFEKRLQAAIDKDADYRARLTVRRDHLERLSDFTQSMDSKDEPLALTKHKGQELEQDDENDYESAEEIENHGDLSPTAISRNRSVSFLDKHYEESVEKEAQKKKKKQAVKLDPKDDDKTLDLHDNNLINWYREEANLLLVDYLIKSNFRGQRSVGLKLLKSLSISNPKYMKLIDYDLFDNFNKVFVSIIDNHDLELVNSWFEDNRTSLKKINSNLEFEINYCKFLSFIEDGKTDEAIKFSQTNLSPAGNKSYYQPTDLTNYDKNLKKLKEIGGLLVYLSISEPESSAKDESDIPLSTLLMKKSQRYHDYEKLISNDRWTSLSDCFIDNFTRLYGISKNYPLFIYLSSGLSSLKTKSCYCNNENTIFVHDREEKFIPTNPLTDKKYRGPNYYYKLLGKINNCPVCSPELFKLSRNLPYAQLITSIFNNPFKLPNGNIYPFEKLLTPNDLLTADQVRDPLTQEIFDITSCVRVYPA